MIGAVVVHHREQRDLVMGRGPQHSRSVVQVAVALNADRQPAVLLIGEGCAHSRGSLVADARAALRADIVIGFAEVPQPRGPGTDEAVVRNERPVFILDLSPQFGGKAGGADGALVPADGGKFAMHPASLPVYPGAFLAARLAPPA